jgi:hypothetical protein
VIGIGKFRYVCNVGKRCPLHRCHLNRSCLHDCNSIV